jgi:hypothetical protein
MIVESVPRTVVTDVQALLELQEIVQQLPWSMAFVRSIIP